MSDGLWIDAMGGRPEPTCCAYCDAEITDTTFARTCCEKGTRFDVVSRHMELKRPVDVVKPTVWGHPECHKCHGNGDTHRSDCPLAEISAPDRAALAAEAKAQALENIRLYAARHRREEWATHVLRFLADAGVKGSPLREVPVEPNDMLAAAILFHNTYERLAPSFGYETRPDTKAFDPESKNGRLMVATCGEVLAALAAAPAPAYTVAGYVSGASSVITDRPLTANARAVYFRESWAATLSAARRRQVS